MELTGAPKTVGEVIDFSSIGSGNLKGLSCLLVKTERGKIGTPIFVSSTQQYRRDLGGLLANSQDPYMVLRMLKRKGRAWICPIGHYTNPNDPATLQATAATASITDSQDSDSDSDTTESTHLTASSPGEWANTVGGSSPAGLTCYITAAKSGNALNVDILVKLVGYPELDQKLNDVTRKIGATEKTDVNRQLKLIQLGTIVSEILEGTYTFSGGARHNDQVVYSDYVGSAVAGTGIYAFDSVKDAVRICVPGMADNRIDRALCDYVTLRKDMFALIRTPLGLDKDGVLDYRNQTGSYSGVAVDCWQAQMWTGGLVTKDDSNADVSHAELADILANYSRKDSTKEAWYSPSGLNRGVIEDATNVVYDFGTPGRQGDFDQIYLNGVNAIINDYDPDKGPVRMMSGNKTTWKKPQLIQKANVAEMLIWLYRMVQPKIKFKQFDPNDPTMWLELYQDINPILREAKNKRAFSDYKYIGDQFAQKKEDATFNSLDELDAGKYRLRILTKPISATEFIGFELGVANSGVSFEDIVNN